MLNQVGQANSGKQDNKEEEQNQTELAMALLDNENFK